MAFEIVDGMTGTKHISSDDLSALNIATIGKADCVLKYGDDFKLTMESANSATLGTGVGMVGGKRFWNQAATSLTVQSGTQGKKRNDLVVARYAKTGTGVESITPVVIKGTPSTGTAADPATTHDDLKLWRIPLDGISVGAPVRLFDTVDSLASLEESVSPSLIECNISEVSTIVYKIGKIAFVTVSGTLLTSIAEWSTLVLSRTVPQSINRFNSVITSQNTTDPRILLTVVGTELYIESKGASIPSGSWLFGQMIYICK